MASTGVLGYRLNRPKGAGSSLTWQVTHFGGSVKSSCQVVFSCLPFVAALRQMGRHQALREGAPADFMLGQRHGDAQHGALSRLVHANGDEHSRFLHQFVLAHPLVAGTEIHTWAGTKWASMPGFQGGIEHLCRLASLSTVDGKAAQMLGDKIMNSGGDLVGGDALQVHLRQRQIQY